MKDRWVVPTLCLYLNKGVIVTWEGRFRWANCGPNDIANLPLMGFAASGVMCSGLFLESPVWDFVEPPGLPVGRLPRGSRSLFPAKASRWSSGDGSEALVEGAHFPMRRG